MINPFIWKGRLWKILSCKTSSKICLWKKNFWL